MSSERENFYQPLKYVDYNIAGNALRAYYDMDNKLVFVMDFAISDTKPNVLLVINPVGNRKWDDILMNDYGVDLETVRPKKDNKYQKLDIEYVGLAEYDALIDAYNKGLDLSNALNALGVFRNDASQRAATERLAAAELTAERARETMDKTQDSVADMNDKLKMLRAKLAGQKRNIGKEPTKQSAAKILRTESQIDVINDKLSRAKKRMASAQKRLAAAEDDADVARAMLKSLEDMGADNVPAMPVNTDVVPVRAAPTPMPITPQMTEMVPYDESENDGADEYVDDDDVDVADEVKPLLDKDPNILDENIAFKPIDFNASPIIKDNTNVAPVAVPTSFEVPAEPEIEEDITETTEYDNVAPVPMLDALTPVGVTENMSNDSEQIDSELMAQIEPVPSVAPMVEDVPVVEEVAPVVPHQPVNPVPMPEIAVAPIDSGFRPVSPIAEKSEDVAPVRDMPKKPTVIYYILLVTLIVLSVFTLWFYQRTTNDVLPELGAKTSGETVVVDDAAPSPFINVEDDKTGADGASDSAPDADVAKPVLVEEAVAEVVAEPVPVVVEPVPVVPDDVAEPVLVEEAVAEVVAEPVTVVPDDVAEPVLVEEAVAEVVAEPVPVVMDEVPVVPESPFISDEEVQPVQRKSIDEILDEKPLYNVSQQEKMFVAGPEYETEELDDVIVMGEPICSDGSAPDADGCCYGEVLSDMGDGRIACCSEVTGECFEPLL